MKHRFNYGDAVRVIRNLRDDGTFPGEKTGNLLVRRGSIGYVRDMGTFLQDQIIYTVHFLDADRVIGCREEELIGSDEPWVATRFESRERVRSAMPLGFNGQIVVQPGVVGEVLKVMRSETGNSYQVLFADKAFVVAERGLAPLQEGGHE
ncbi:MAG TPA: nitrogen fixation protein NifZ [Gammaproteobacteria bacterium]